MTHGGHRWRWLVAGIGVLVMAGVLFLIAAYISPSVPTSGQVASQANRACSPDGGVQQVLATSTLNGYVVVCRDGLSRSMAG
jgi:hypothetical protein